MYQVKSLFQLLQLRLHGNWAILFHPIPTFFFSVQKAKEKKKQETGPLVSALYGNTFCSKQEVRLNNVPQCMQLFGAVFYDCVAVSVSVALCT